METDPATHYLRCEGAIRPVCGTPHDVATTTDRAKVTCSRCRGTFAYRHPRPARPEDRYDTGLTRAVALARALYARDEPGGCEDYARGLASLIAAAFRIPGRRDEIEDAITGRDTEAEDAADVAEAVAALAEGGEPVPAGQVWDELGLIGDEAARRSQAEVLSQARDTREHMRSWAAGEVTHHGEAQDDA